MTNRETLVKIAEDKIAGYDDEMIDDLLQMFSDRLKGLSVQTIDEDLVEEVWLDWKEGLPDPDQWALDEAEGTLMDMADAKYDEMKEEGLL